jgi:hypothetical protein
MPMSGTMLRPFASFWADEKPAPKPRKPTLSPEERKRQSMSAYLVQLSRKSPRGAEFAARQDELRAMVQRAQATSDPYERNAIINAMRNKGMIDE